MPKSKSKRGKTYRPRPVKVGPYVTAEFLADAKDRINNVLLIIETQLPAGACTDAEMDVIEDLLNWGLGILDRRKKHLDPGELAEFGPIILEARAALSAVFHRHNTGASSGYVCTGDELQAIRAGFDIVGPMIKEALELSAYQTICEFEWARGLAVQHTKEKMKKETQHE